MSAAPTICVSWRCPRAVDCLTHDCHHTWADLVAVKDAGRTVNLESTGENCTDYTEDFATARETPRGGR